MYVIVTFRYSFTHYVYVYMHISIYVSLYMHAFDARRACIRSGVSKAKLKI